jgi:uncharacterized membrane protein YeaQ/YmgE (transglycosylase-associated protein family)
MNSLIVISWVAMGAFAAWIGTHITRNRARGSGVGNLAVGILGALLGGLLAHAMLHGRHGYDAFLICAGVSLFVAVFLIGITRVGPRRRPARPGAL